MIYAVATGCSHTAGVGNDINDCYVNRLESHYKLPILNLATLGGNCNDVLMSIVDAVQRNPLPAFIIAQWPNPIRRNVWIKGKKRWQTIMSGEESFHLLLKNGEENFYESWMQAIIIGNLLARQASVPIINIFLESIDQHQQYLEQLNKKNITLHVNEHLPGKTWYFDFKAQDNQHHSPWCHQKWAERLIGLIDEHTTQ